MLKEAGGSKAEGKGGSHFERREGGGLSWKGDTAASSRGLSKRGSILQKGDSAGKRIAKNGEELAAAQPSAECRELKVPSTACCNKKKEGGGKLVEGGVVVRHHDGGER